MYADRYAPKRLNRGSLGLSIAIVGPVLAAALLTSPAVRHIVKPDPFIFVNVDPVPPPPPPDPIPRPQSRTLHPIDAPIPRVPIPTPIPQPITAPDPTPTADTGTVIGPISVPSPEPTKIAPPVLVGPEVDPRYANALQPAYPAVEQRAGRDGVVTLRVLIGIDGRVKQAEQVSATSDDFWRVTERQALTRWRFRPATRDGIPTEGWRTMTVRFNLQDQ